MTSLSLGISQEVDIYRHCDYQTAIAAISVSYNDPFIIVVSPTGSGKTWIQGLISRYHSDKGQKVTLIEPSDMLRIQTAEKLGYFDYSISITSIESYYCDGPWRDVIIINEYDTIFNEKPYICSSFGLHGLWQFKGKKVYAFSATSSAPYERFFNNCIGPPKVLRFKSEYQMVHGV